MEKTLAYRPHFSRFPRCLIPRSAQRSAHFRSPKLHLHWDAQYNRLWLEVTAKQWDQTRLSPCDVWKLPSNKLSRRKLRYQKKFWVCWTTTWSLRHAKWNVKSSFMFWPFHFATLRRKYPQSYCESIRLHPDWRASGLSVCPSQIL